MVVVQFSTLYVSGFQPFYIGVSVKIKQTLQDRLQKSVMGITNTGIVIIAFVNQSKIIGTA